jgi:hypothetical protein
MVKLLFSHFLIATGSLREPVAIINPNELVFVFHRYHNEKIYMPLSDVLFVNILTASSLSFFTIFIKHSIFPQNLLSREAL